MAIPIDVLVLKFREIWLTGIGEIVRCLPDQKNRLSQKLSLLHGSSPKSAKASPQQCTHSAPVLIQISPLSAEL